MQKVRKLALVGIVPSHVLFSSDPAVSSPIFVGEKWESLMQKVPDLRSGGKVTVYERLQGLESVLAGTNRTTLAWRRTCKPKRHSPMSRRSPSLARNSAPDPQVSFVHPNRFSVLSEVVEENDDFETVETNPSSVHPKDYEASQAPRPRNQNPELRTRSGRKLNLEDKTTSTFSPVEPRNRRRSHRLFWPWSGLRIATPG